MPPRNGSKSIRSSSRNKGKKKDPQPAVNNAHHASSPAAHHFSPTRNEELPSAKKTTTKVASLTAEPSESPEHVSDLSFTFIDTQNINHTCNSKETSVNGLVTSDSSENKQTDSANDGTSLDMSDNTEFSMSTYPPNVSTPSQDIISSGYETPPPVHPFNSTPEDPWHLTFNELKTMRARMGTLEKVEAATLNFAQQLQELTGRNSATEKKVSSNTNKIKEMREEIVKLRDTVEKQQQAIQEISKLRDTVEKQQQTIQGLHKLKDDFKKTSHNNITEMNSLVEQQREQVGTIRNLRQEIKLDAQKQKEQLHTFHTSQETTNKNMQKQITQAKEDADHKFLVDEAFKKRQNIVIIALPEQQDISTFSVVLTFFKSQLKLNRIWIETAYRMGRTPTEERPYTRPIMVRFASMVDRNQVWKKRFDIPQTEGQAKIKIQADLPKKLRDANSILYRVVKEASSMEHFKDAMVKDFAIVLHGKQYTVDKLELLPPPLRPSSLAVKESDEALVFFSRHSFLSNHHPSRFDLDGKTFHNMEHFLAFKKAQLTHKDDIIEGALQAKDPVEAKSVLNSLRKNYTKDWEKIRAQVSLTGLREKFRQNAHLADLLRDTRQLKLGEASKDPCWGVGYTLEDQHVLDVDKWNKQGNLLGKSLMQIRSEIRSSTTESSPPQG